MNRKSEGEQTPPTVTEKFIDIAVLQHTTMWTAARARGLTGIPRMSGQFGHHHRRIATEPGLQQR
jgi:hypothetical protein